MNLRKTWRKIRYPFSAAAIRLVVRLVARMRYSHLEKTARLTGWAAHLFPRNRRIIHANLRTAFPDWSEDRIRRVCRESLNNTCLTGLEFVWFSGRPKLVADSVVYGSSEAYEILQQAARQDVPMLFLTPHVGNWEMSAQFACTEGARLCAVARGVKNPGIARLMLERRSQNGLELLPQKGAVKGIVQALRDGKSVGVLMDQNTRERRGGIFVDFFGLPVPTTRAPASLARKMNVQAACFACIRREGRFELHVKSLPRPIADYTDDVELTQGLLKLNEAFAREYPEQYLWLYERWRYVPDGISENILAHYPFYRKDPTPEEGATTEDATC